MKGLVDIDGEVVKGGVHAKYHMLRHMLNGMVIPGELGAEGRKQTNMRKDYFFLMI